MVAVQGFEPCCPFTAKCSIFKNFLALKEESENPLTQISHKSLRLIRREETKKWMRVVKKSTGTNTYWLGKNRWSESNRQPFSSKLQQLSSSGNYPPTPPLPWPNFRGTHQKMEVGTWAVPGRSGQEDWGEWDDDSQLGEGKNKTG